MGRWWAALALAVCSCFGTSEEASDSVGTADTGALHPEVFGDPDVPVGGDLLFVPDVPVGGDLLFVPDVPAGGDLLAVPDVPVPHDLGAGDPGSSPWDTGADHLVFPPPDVDDAVSDTAADSQPDAASVDDLTADAAPVDTKDGDGGSELGDSGSIADTADAAAPPDALAPADQGNVTDLPEASPDAGPDVVDAGPSIACLNDSDCDLGDPCTTGACSAQLCVFQPLDCDDGLPETQDGCLAGTCVHDPGASVAPSSGPIELAAAGPVASPDVAALSDGSFVVVYRSWPGGPPQVMWRRFLPNGAPAGAAMMVSSDAGTTATPRVAARGTAWMVAWQSADGGLRGQMYSGQATLGDAWDVLADGVAPDGGLCLIATPDGYAIAAGLADDTSTVTWMDDKGASLAAWSSPSALGAASEPALASLGGETLLVSFTLTEQGEGDADVAAIVLEPGAVNPVSSIVNGFAADQQGRPAVARLLDGSLLAVWTSWNQDGGGADTLARRLFTAAGEPLTKDMRLAGYTGLRQGAPTSVALPDGRAVVVWEADRPDASIALRGRIVGQPGDLDSPLFELPAGEAATRTEPAIDAWALGGYVVVWHEGTAPDQSQIRGLVLGSACAPGMAHCASPESQAECSDDGKKLIAPSPCGPAQSCRGAGVCSLDDPTVLSSISLYSGEQLPRVAAAPLPDGSFAILNSVDGEVLRRQLAPSGDATPLVTTIYSNSYAQNLFESLNLSAWPSGRSLVAWRHCYAMAFLSDCYQAAQAVAPDGTPDGAPTGLEIFGMNGSDMRSWVHPAGLATIAWTVGLDLDSGVAVWFDQQASYLGQALSQNLAMSSGDTFITAGAGFYDGTGFLVHPDSVWGDDLWLRWERPLDSVGLPVVLGGSFLDGLQACAAPDGGVVAVWRGVGGLEGLRLDPAGDPVVVGTVLVQAACEPRNPSVACLPDGRAAVVWAQPLGCDTSAKHRAHVALFDHMMQLEAGPLELDGDGPFTLRTSAAPAEDGRFVVVWVPKSSYGTAKVTARVLDPEVDFQGP